MHAALEKRATQGNLRSLPPTFPAIDFASNDYLGLARSQPLAAAIFAEWQQLYSQETFRIGSTGSRLLTGNHSYIERLEQQIAHFHGYAAGLFFNNGYMANLGLLQALGTDKDCFVYDTHVHASMHDGLRLSRAHCLPWRHQDLDHLEQRLKNRSSYRQLFVCVETVCSIDGTCAPLKEIAALCNAYEANLIVDEAHAVGLFGSEGRGLVAAERLQARCFAQVVTFGKALGVQGAIVLGSATLKQFLINFARPFIYTTAPSALHFAAIRCSYAFFPKLEKERQKLRQLIAQSAKTTSPIQYLLIPTYRRTKAVAQQLQIQGFDVRPLLPPTVPRGQEGLRLCLHSFNTSAELERLQCVLSSLV